jgi:hypothetical protein
MINVAGREASRRDLQARFIEALVAIGPGNGASIASAHLCV